MRPRLEAIVIFLLFCAFSALCVGMAWALIVDEHATTAGTIASVALAALLIIGAACLAVFE